MFRGDSPVVLAGCHLIKDNVILVRGLNFHELRELRILGDLKFIGFTDRGIHPPELHRRCHETLSIR